jgi:LEA14-like dessication related protein
MVFARVLESVKGIRPGSVVPYEVAMTLSVDAPAVGTLSLPISKKGQFPVPTVPSIELTEIHWQSLSFDRAVAVMKVKVGNRNEFPVDLSMLSLSLALADTPILSTAVDKPASFLAGQDNTLEIPISFAPRDLGLAAFQIIRGAGSGYKLSGLLKANTAFGAIDFPYEQTGQTRFR